MFDLIVFKDGFTDCCTVRYITFCSRDCFSVDGAIFTPVLYKACV